MAANAPVVVFLPAYDEEAVVARVVRRIPSRVAGRETVVLVIDDGSTDGRRCARSRPEPP